MRTYKPWTVYARFLDPILASLHAAVPFEIETYSSIHEWVANIPFREIMEADLICGLADSWQPGKIHWVHGNLFEAQDTAAEQQYHQRMAIQIALRIKCAIDLARCGPPSTQKRLDWRGILRHDLNIALHQHWHDNALWWAYNYGPRHLKDSPSQ